MMNEREIEKYTKGFILKCMNVIIESRLGESVVRKCSPRKNDWFNITMYNNEEVTQSCIECLDNIHWVDPKAATEEQKLTSGFTVNTRWKIACEVSLKTQEGKLISLEYWMFENNPVSSSPDSPSGASPTGLSPNSPCGSPFASLRSMYSFGYIHSRMGLMLKSLMSLTRASPTFKLSCTASGDQSHVIFYRICQCDPDFDSFLQSINPETPEVQKHFSSEIRLGCIPTSINSLGVSYCRRLKLDNYRLLQPTTPTKTVEDDPAPFKEDHFGGARKPQSPEKPRSDEKDREPSLAFGSSSPVVLHFPLLPPLPKGFPGISDDEDDDLNNPTGNPDIKTPDKTKLNSTTPMSDSELLYCGSASGKNKNESTVNEVKSEKTTPSASKPVPIPNDRRNYHEPRRVDSSPPGSLESYVFIENKPPFAPDNDDIEILFTGPTPSFVTNPSGGGELLNIQETLDTMATEFESIETFLDTLNLDDEGDGEERLSESTYSK